MTPGTQEPDHRGNPTGPGVPGTRRRDLHRAALALLGVGTAAVVLNGSAPNRDAVELLGPDLPGLDPTGRRDSAPALQELYDQGARLVSLAPRGTYRLDSPVFLDDDGPFDRFVLQGNGATLRLGDGLAATDAFTADPETRWAFLANSTRASGPRVEVSPATRATGPDVGGTLRFVVRDVVVDGGGRNVGLAFLNRCAARFEGVVMTAARALVSWFDYCDGIVLDQCHARVDTVPDAWLLYQVANGDGIVLVSPKTERGIGAARLQNCKGATIQAPVSGRFSFDRCRAVHVTGGHTEADLSAVTAFAVRASSVTLDTSVLYPSRDADAPTLVVDDDDDGNGSTVVLRQVTEMVLHRDGSSSVRAERQGDVVAAPLVEVRRTQPGTTLSVDGAATQVGTLATGARWLPSAGWRVVSPDPEITTALESDSGSWLRATGRWQLARRDRWRVLPLGGSSAYCPDLQAPEIVDAQGSLDGVRGVLGGQVSYVAALRDAQGGWSGLSEATRADVGGSGSVRVRIRTTAPATLVLWRSRGDGVAARAEGRVSLGVPAGVVTVYDTGQFLGGLPWVAASGDVPETLARRSTTGPLLVLDGATLPLSTPRPDPLAPDLGGSPS
ncbi:hypothetical protein ACFFKU_17650 [Kineococcus gynurae]|uniref:Parallel beta helix pectate lyase-like protein n=1 Tax=Kineococcus gynurae TaxID=452979 RepID=A0ABV5LNR7_9ACTN